MTVLVPQKRCEFSMTAQQRCAWRATIAAPAPRKRRHVFRSASSFSEAPSCVAWQGAGGRSRLRPSYGRTALLLCPGADFGLPLRIGQRTQFVLHAALESAGFTARLEAGEVGTVAPGQRPAQPHTGLDSSVVHDVDLTLIIGIVLLVAGVITQIARRGEHRG